jgi:hypothetical protein
MFSYQRTPKDLAPLGAKLVIGNFADAGKSPAINISPSYSFHPLPFGKGKEGKGLSRRTFRPSPLPSPKGRGR